MLALASSGCLGGPAPEPTPDPFAGLSKSAEQTFRDGLKLYEDGKFRDALSAFERARILSPQNDPRIQEFIERARAALAPTPTPAPPTPTPAPPTPTLAPVFVNPGTPDTDLGARYFGQVFLAVVPGRSFVPPPSNEFYFEDQVGLYVEALDQRLRIPFTLRVFDLDTGKVVANVRQEGASPSPQAPGARPSGTTSAASAPGAPLTSGAPSPTATGTPTPGEPHVVRFWDRFVWYHEGGEAPGRYRLELYSGSTLTNTIDYVVGNVPLALALAAGTPAPGSPQAAAAPALAGGEDVPTVPIRRNGGGSVGGASVPPPSPTPTPMPTPTPTPAPAATTLVGGLPAGLDSYAAANRVYVADASGVVWTVDGTRPTLARPFNLDRLPVDLTVDQGSGTLYISARSDPSVVVLSGQTGQRINTIPLPVDPGDVQLDAALGLLYVVLPERQEIALVDVRAGRYLRSTTTLAQVTGMALDAQSHTLFVTHLTGQMSILDSRNGQLLNRVALTGAGLSGVATARGLAYAINTPTRELLVVDPRTLTVTRYGLPDYPGGIGAGEDSGAVYVLGTTLNALLRIDPTDGTELGRVLLPDRSGRFGVKLQQRDYQGLRSRLSLRQADETVYITQPEAGLLSVVPPTLFPSLGREIPWPEEGAVASPPVAAVALANPPMVRPTAAPAPTPVPGVLAQGADRVSQDEPEPVADVRAATTTGPALDWAVRGGQFFTQANGAPVSASRKGFPVTDAANVSFWSSYQYFGGPGVLGYPVSTRFQWRGRQVQLTQRALLQWWPEARETRLVNLLDELHDAGYDDRLLVERWVPRQQSFAAERGLTFEQVKAARLALLDADPSIGRAYYSVPDPVQTFGLPTSPVLDLGPVRAIRTQRGVLQHWKVDMAWARSGDVTAVLAGDLARDLGLFGSSTAPFVPADPMAPDLSARRGSGSEVF